PVSRMAARAPSSPLVPYTTLFRSGRIVTPLVQAERRVGGNNIEQHEVAVFIQQLGVTDGVAPFDLVVVFAVQKHIHLGQRPSGANGFLTIQGVVLAVVMGAYLAATFHQQ